MNNALVELYGADNLERLASKATSFSHSIWDKAVKWLHSRRGFDIEDKPVRALMDETYRVLSEGVSGAITEEVPEELTRSLLNNTFIFSGFKTYHEMKQASALLRSSKGGFKSFDEFYRDVKKIDNTYNRSYLAAEYEFAVQSTQMAVKWKDWEEMGDRYLLQYRTAGDERVREEHAALNNTTLPMDDKFWDSYLPPLGWRCRCTVVQVRKGKYRISDSDAACKAGEHATSLPKQKIFRFNPGKTGKVFPPKHPYLPKGCGNCTRKLLLSYNPESEKCKACAIITKQAIIESRRREYERLKNDPNYKDVEFDERTGGLKATHVGHTIQDSDKVEKFFDGMKPADLEFECQNLLFKWGHAAVLRDEFHNNRQGNTLPSLDIEIDDKIMDIRSITEGRVYGYALKAKNKQLGNVKRKTGVVSDCACLHFHDPNMFSEEKLLRDIEWFKISLEEEGIRQRIKHIYVVVNGENSLKIYDI